VRGSSALAVGVDLDGSLAAPLLLDGQPAPQQYAWWTEPEAA
jgi:hypothetical protein